MKYILLLLLSLLAVFGAEAQTWVSTTGSTIGEINLTTAAVTDEAKLLVLSNGRVQELGSSLWLFTANNALYGRTQGGFVYSIATTTLVADQNGTMGYLATPTAVSQTQLQFTIRTSPSPAEILNNGANYAPLPGANGAASVDQDGQFAEDGNNTLYAVTAGSSRVVGRSSTQGNIQSIATVSQTPEADTLIYFGGGFLMICLILAKTHRLA